jgi:D-alanyl-D-alanine carboxypeptidase
MSEDQKIGPEAVDLEKSSGLGGWLEGPVLRLFLLPAILILAVAALIGLNQDLLKAPVPGTARPVETLPGVGEGQSDTQVYLEAGETLRLGTSYHEDAVHKIVGQNAVFQGNLVLVNPKQRLPEDYQAQGLMVVNDLEDILPPEALIVSKAGTKLNQEAADALVQMIQAAADQGIGGFTLVSGHREVGYQSELFEKKVQKYMAEGLDRAAAEQKAREIVAVPGESEHHTGLAMDLPSQEHIMLETSYANTINGRWLSENAWRYGFIIRYPQDKTDITGISYEPWHLRYVGKPHSELMHREGWCLEEYIQILRQNRGLTAKTEDGTIWQIDYQIPENGMIVIPLIVGTKSSGDGLGGYIVTAPVFRPIQ